MDSVTLAPGVLSTRIGFGCAGLMRQPSTRERQRLLLEAFEQGIRHFDVARMYGLGAAEREVGRFASTRRDSVVIATKFGIDAAPAAGRLARWQGPARRLIARYPALRRYAKRHTGTLHQAHRYDAATARASLQTSLRELGTDYVDIMFLHDPAPSDDVDLAEIGDYLDQARAAGLIRAWGIAGEQDPCLDLMRSSPSTSVLQLRDQALLRTDPLPDDVGPLITFGVLGDALAHVARHLTEFPDRRAEWSEALEVDCSSSDGLATLLLCDALNANDRGVVLYSTTRPERLKWVTEVASRTDRKDASMLSVIARAVRDHSSPAC